MNGKEPCKTHWQESPYSAEDAEKVRTTHFFEKQMNRAPGGSRGPGGVGMCGELQGGRLVRGTI